ncbi:MAG: hypothetical protein HY287_02365 [Planctomycetes bacterium]|nr:hypothetical protein [Planctomycetota bacterium]MBI3833153.1 hypothetical protein [Planctomycetota bacterium]
MMARIAKSDITAVGEQMVRLAAEYGQTEYHREMRLDGMLLGILDSRFGSITRQYPVSIGKSRRRIDFRQGGTRPVLLEFAVQTPGKNQIYGSQNRSELHKLERQANSKVSLRCLLLLDLSGKPVIDENQLKATYTKQASSRGNFKRYPVWVFYVHADASYSFRWRPRST